MPPLGRAHDVGKTWNGALNSGFNMPTLLSGTGRDMKRLIGICFLAGAAAAAAFTDRPWGTAQAQQTGDAPRTARRSRGRTTRISPGPLPSLPKRAIAAIGTRKWASSSSASRRPPPSAISYFPPHNSNMSANSPRQPRQRPHSLAFAAECIARLSTSKMTAVDQPNISTPFIAVIGPSSRQRSTGITLP
jgi:hypothetical protein